MGLLARMHCTHCRTCEADYKGYCWSKEITLHPTYCGPRKFLFLKIDGDHSMKNTIWKMSYLANIPSLRQPLIEIITSLVKLQITSFVAVRSSKSYDLILSRNRHLLTSQRINIPNQLNETWVGNNGATKDGDIYLYMIEGNCSCLESPSETSWLRYILVILLTEYLNMDLAIGYSWRIRNMKSSKKNTLSPKLLLLIIFNPEITIYDK